jgi:hypothetical protein
VLEVAKHVRKVGSGAGPHCKRFRTGLSSPRASSSPSTRRRPIGCHSSAAFTLWRFDSIIVIICLQERFLTHRTGRHPRCGVVPSLSHASCVTAVITFQVEFLLHYH